MLHDRVLFVEDNALISLITSDFLREEGFEVTSVGGVRAAMHALGATQGFAALITDINLGPGQDGYDVARSARFRCPAMAVIYISGSEVGRHQAEGVCGSHFIAKPFEPDQIREALLKVLIQSG
jgi:DNA-binding response OmpR family regulator